MGTSSREAAGKPSHIEATEWALRLELAACYRVFEWLGWTENIGNHITVRVPGPKRHFLINPFGLWYDEVTASNLVKIDLDGNPIDAHPYPVNRAGFIIHGAIHRARLDAHCIMHTHTTAGMAIACGREGLRHDDFYGAMLSGRIAYHTFEGISIHADEQPRLLASLGQKNVMVLRNHGLLVAEHDIAHAFALMWTVQRACEVQCLAAAMGGYDLALPEPVRESCKRDALHLGPDGGISREMFEAAVRKMERDKHGPNWIDYRT